MNKYGHWDLLIDDFDNNLYYGFIYVIINKINGKKYIGKKNFYTRKKKETDWKTYVGSQFYLQKDISEIGKENFDFEIIELQRSRDDLNRRENEIQVINNVLKARFSNGERAFYNRSINNEKFDSSGIKHREWLKNPKIYPSYNFENIYTGEIFIGSHIDLGEKIGVDSKRILRLIRNVSRSIHGWKKCGAESGEIRKRIRTIQNIKTNEYFTGSTNQIIEYIGTTLYCLKDLYYGRQKSTRGWQLIK
jgi:hypothetical protein